jgi:hypothetical protein
LGDAKRERENHGRYDLPALFSPRFWTISSALKGRLQLRKEVEEILVGGDRDRRAGFATRHTVNVTAVWPTWKGYRDVNGGRPFRICL